MRYQTVLANPGKPGFIPVFDTLCDDVVKREQLHHFNLLADKTVVLLYRLRGDLDRARTAFETSSSVLRYDVPEQGNGLTYLHCEMREPLTTILSLLHESEVIMAMPIAFLSDNRLRITFIGEHEPLCRLFAEMSEVIDMQLEKTGEYGSEERRPDSVLTDRQREIMTIAVEHEYYQVPRRATIQDIADEVGLSQATVGEHLQKIEAKVFFEIAR